MAGSVGQTCSQGYKVGGLSVSCLKDEAVRNVEDQCNSIEVLATDSLRRTY
jgi:hypothetical protein